VRSSDYLFPLGRCVATPGALEALRFSGEDALTYLQKHVTGVQGALDDDDHKLNQEAIKLGNRVLSSYMTIRGTKIWVITEADRSVTTLLLPSEY
jgi:hypothetical protein